MSDESNVRIAENSGFCFGVKRATDELEKRIAAAGKNEKIYTLGNLIHNKTYIDSLGARGVRAIGVDEIEQIANEASDGAEVTLLIRAHGITVETEEILKKLSLGNEHFRYIDCTCPFVKKIHKIAAENSGEDNIFILFGTKDHPEAVGIMSYFKGEKAVFADSEEFFEACENGRFGNLHKKTPIIAAQTTFNLAEWRKCQKIIKKVCTNAIIFDTICSVTEARQSEACQLSRECDFVIVIGGRESSNTAKLYEICKGNCNNTVWIENVGELKNSIPLTHGKVGIVAGASTPYGIIEEVYKTMSEMKENFAQMLDESFKTLNTGDIVTGTVCSVSDTEIQLDLGTNVTGYIKAEQITDDASAKLTSMFKKGDKVEAFVIRVSDIEGYAELSKKRVDSDKNRKAVADALETGDALEGKVVDVVKGGVVVLVNAVRVFVPASQTGVPKDGDLATLSGQTVKVKVIEVKDKKIVGSIRAVAREERRALEADFWANIENGKHYSGVVKSMTSYGAFVDLGGVDGMVHASELSWKHIKNPAEVLSIGDTIEVFVKSFDAEKRRISLGYKTEETNPWVIFTSQFHVDDVVPVKIVNMMPFGAFAEIIDGVDGLIHISQIANKRIAKPADVLEIGQIVDAKIIEIDNEKQKVSLSIRVLLEDAQAAEEAMPEEAAAEEATAEATAEAEAEAAVETPAEE